MFISWQPRALVPMAEQMQPKRQKWRAIGTTDHHINYVPGGTRGHRGGHYSNKVAPRWSYSTAPTSRASTKWNLSKCGERSEVRSASGKKPDSLSGFPIS